MSNLLDKFGLGSDLFSAVADTPEVFETTGRTTTLHAGRKIAFKGTINGIEVPAYATLQEATLSRMSVIEQKSPYTGETYKIVTGIFKPVKMNIDVVIDGETMSLPEVLRAFVNTNAEKPVDEQAFLDTASRIGLKFLDGMPLLWQQFGASEAGIAHAFDAFKAAGAVDVLSSMENRGNIVAAYAHEAGIPVTSFEIGTVDRGQSRTGQGFMNLVDASVDQFQRIIRLRKEASVLKTELATQTDWAQKKIKAAEDRIKVLGNMSRQWTTNWAGAQQIIKVDEGGKLVPQDQFAAVNAPCGRFSMVVDGKTVAVDLWKNSARAESAPMNTATNAVVADGDDEELPF
jgi:hypothetical protein